jgi:lipoate-protein ligase A
MTTLEASLGRRPSFDETAAALADGFREASGLALVPGGLDRDEDDAMQRLVRDKYEQEHWTQSGRVPRLARARS